jgi:outer membrane protein TolC
MPSARRLVLQATLALALNFSPRTNAQDELIRRPNPLVPPHAVCHLTLEDAKQRALAANKGLVLANLAVQEKREATAAARTDYLPKLLGNDSYFHFNANLGVVNTVRTGRLGILPVGAQPVAVTAIKQDSNLLALTLAQPITKLIAVNARGPRPGPPASPTRSRSRS